VGGRAGYALNASERVTFWPMAGINVNHASDSMQHTSNTSVSVHIFAPFLYHVAPHFFLGVGPSFDLAINGGGKDFGIDSIVGGWF
jgi:hypothetical protein